MRIAIFSDTFTPEINGVATSTYNLFLTLRAHGEEVVVVTTNHFDNQFKYEDGVMRIPGITILKKAYGYKLAGFYNAEAAKILKEFKPEVIHIQTDGGIGQFGFITASALKCASVYTFHTMLEDYAYYVTRGVFLERVSRGILRGYVRYKSTEADEFITPSKKIQDYMRSIGVDSYINVIPTGINFKAFDRNDVDPAKVKEIKKKYGIEGKKVLLSLGRVAKEKSIDICIEGYAKYLSTAKDDNSIMMVVGGGPAIDELIKFSEKLGIKDKVIFTDKVLPSEAPLYYSLGDVFCSASITETQGLTFMESMASFNILFARYDDSLTSLIKDGQNGFFFFDSDDFAAKLPSLFGLKPEEKEKILLEAMKSIDPYSLDVFYSSVMEVYRRAIRKKW
ncbi:MAG: glycosyltransferase [Bacilli bacterium]|nr:glycosyltransferase [Bacilli bacterium]